MHRLLTGTVDARALAVCRVLVGLAAAATLPETTHVLAAVADGALAMPVVGVTVAAPWPDVLLAVGLLAAAATVLGVHARPAAGVVAACGTAALLLDEQAYSNHLVLLVCLAAVLACARTDAAWALRRVGADGPRGLDVPGWPAFLLLVQVTATYLWTGVAKLNPEFLSGDVLRAYTAVPDAWAGAVAVASVGTELALAVVLWVPRARVVGLAVGAALHWSIVALVHDRVPLVAFAALVATGYVVAGHEARDELRAVRRALDRPVGGRGTRGRAVPG